jgi:hypothetical protein
MTTHENLNVVGQISRAASPPDMKNGRGQSILGVLPMFRKSVRRIVRFWFLMHVSFQTSTAWSSTWLLRQV